MQIPFHDHVFLHNTIFYILSQEFEQAFEWFENVL